MRLLPIALALVACTKQVPEPPPLELVTGGAKAEDHLPVIVALHGLGDRPESFAEAFAGFGARARILVPRGTTPDGRGGYRWFESRTQDGDVARISSELEAATESIDRLLVRLNDDGVRPIVTGFSQGGMLAFAIAARHPDHVRAAVPIGGWLPPPLLPAEKIGRTPPIRALHGTADHVVPFALDQRTCERLRELGFDVELTPYAGIDHTVTPEMHRRWLELLARFAVE